MTTETIVAQERSLLGIVLSDTGWFREAARDIATSDLVEDANRIIWTLLDELSRSGNATTPAAIGQELTRRGMLELVGGADYIAALVGDEGADPRRLAHLVSLLSGASAKRALAAELQREISRLTDPSSDFNEVAGDVRRRLVDLSKRRSTEELPSFAAAGQALLDEMEHGMVSGTPLNIGELDYVYLLGGLKPTQLCILAGTTGGGKTSLATQCALNVAAWAAKQPTKRGPVWMFSFEMGDKSIMSRLVLQSCVLKYGYRPPNAFVGSDRPIATAMIRKIVDLPLGIEDHHTNTVAAIQATLERAIDRQGNPSLVIIDHIGLLGDPSVKGNRTAEMGKISRDLKLMAMGLQIPILALAQLSRQNANRDNHRPILADLKESSGIEQDADIVLFVYRASAFETPEDRKKRTGTAEEGDEAELIIAKNRSGKVGEIPLKWIGPRFRFMDDADRTAEMTRLPAELADETADEPTVDGAVPAEPDYFSVLPPIGGVRDVGEIAALAAAPDEDEIEHLFAS